MGRLPKSEKEYTKVRHVTNLWKHRGGAYYRIATVHGKPVKERLSNDLEVAKRKLLALTKESAKRGNREITFSELCDLFLATKHGKKPGTIRNYKWVMNRCKKESSFWETPVHKIKPLDIQTFVAGLKLDPRGNNLLSSLLNMILEIAVINDYIADNPMLRVRKLLRKKVTKSPQLTPTHPEALKIIQDIENENGSKSQIFADLLRMIYFAGLGEAEAKNMRWEDINWASEKINVQRQKTGKHFYVPFYPWLKNWLLGFHKDQGSPQTGKIFQISVLCRCLTRSCERLQLQKFTAKAFRKACICRLLTSGLDYRLVSKYQGHTDNGYLIISTYSHIINSAEQEKETAELAKLNR